MPAKNQTNKPISIITGRGAERDINRLRILGIAALLICLAIVAYGLLRQQQDNTAAEQAQNKPWTPQR